MSITQTASKLLKKFGEAVVFTYEIGGGFHPDTGAHLPSTVVTVNGFGYPGRYESNDIDGTSIRSGDIRLTVEKISSRPLVGWTVTVDGKAYRVMDVRNVRLSGTDVIYICQLRVV